jgi:hypothetical protein
MPEYVRQLGIVIGLTMILTFPVTVVSGAGSQKQSDHIVRKPAAQWKSPAEIEPGSSAGDYRTYLGRHDQNHASEAHP